MKHQDETSLTCFNTLWRTDPPDGSVGVWVLEGKGFNTLWRADPPDGAMRRWRAELLDHRVSTPFGGLILLTAPVEDECRWECEEGFQHPLAG